MYAQPAFVETDPDVIAAMVDRVGLAVLVTHGPEGLCASHLPVTREGDRFITHLARANPHRARAGPGQGLLIFPGPDAYISPGWYPSKAEHGRAVPTWNYEAVHVHGELAWFEDRDRLLGVVDRLSRRHEAGRPQPWSVEEMPADYRERLLGGIVGLEIRPTRVEALRKLSQNRSAADQAGVAAGLSAEARPDAQAMAALMRAGGAG